MSEFSGDETMRMNRNDCDAATSPPASHVNERDIHLPNSECERDKLHRVVFQKWNLQHVSRAAFPPPKASFCLLTNYVSHADED